MVFKTERRSGSFRSGFAILALIYHATVRNIRKSHRNALIGLLLTILRTVLLLLSFYVMMQILGLNRRAIRGDYLLYLMSGVFLYTTHTATISAVFNAESAISAVMKHAPLTTAVTLAAGALSALYLQILSMLVILGVYHAGWGPISIADWQGALAMVLLSWFTGLGIGLVFFALRPWAPSAVNVIQLIYTRANMIASGKLFLANNLSAKMLAVFSWNPLFHTIDQCRGFTFLNYNPHFSTWSYPLSVGAALLLIGLMAEFFTRQQASASWNARN